MTKKFRVWDKLAQRYILPDKGYQGHYWIDLNGKFCNFQNGAGGGECIVEQFSGYTDKFGKEVFEGDICNIDFYRIGKFKCLIETVVGGFAFLWVNEDEDAPSFPTVIVAQPKSFEILGNRNQNPEML